MADQASEATESAHRANGTFTPVEEAEPQPVVPVVPVEEADPQPVAPVPDDLLGELARAMHLAATAQFERANAELVRRRTEHVESIATRAEQEVERLKAGSEADISAIDAWAKTEAEKIKLERLRRMDARRERLAGELDRQASIKDREIFAIDVAIDAHRQEIERFFGQMERETDPAAIARVASTLPAFPPLAEIAEGARRGAAAEFADVEAATSETHEPVTADLPRTTVDSDPVPPVSETRLMAVMDPDASHAPEAPRPWEAPHAVTVAAGTSESDAPADAQDAPAPAEPPSRVGATLLRTVRAIRPMSGERQDRGDEQP